ncbi:MAG: DUF2238 domain-containing protein [Opitutales bacterium]|nr:DUF2238 domain-containing protein [Opitutales bacterium]
MKSKYVPHIILAILAIAAVLSYIGARDPSVWRVEMASVLIVEALLVFTYPFFKFSNTSYIIVSLWLLMHTIGAHYTFEHVPFGWANDLIGSSRNNYDRVAHFVIGLNSFCVAEWFHKTNRAKGVFTCAFIGVIFIMAMANAWELIEWAYAEIDGGSTGAAFLGSQGDIWDAQKDMLADSLGAVCAAAFFVFKFGRKQ